MSSEEKTIEEIGAKMDALSIWPIIGNFNWAVKPRGTVFPYFCTALKGESAPVKVRFLMIEGWQTFHDFVRIRIDGNYGCYLSPMEMPHFELVILSDGAMKLFRHDACYMPREANDLERKLCARILWQCYGVMLRIVADRSLPLRFASSRAMFSRTERADADWCDEALEIPEPRPYVENFRFAKSDIAKAKDVPFASGEAVEIDFTLVPGLMTREPRPRCVYALTAVDAATGRQLFRDQISPNPSDGLKAMWEGIPARVLGHFLVDGKVPGEIRLRSGRLFRMLRPLCVELPFKLSLHDRLAHI